MSKDVQPRPYSVTESFTAVSMHTRDLTKTTVLSGNSYVTSMPVPTTIRKAENTWLVSKTLRIWILQSIPRLTFWVTTMHSTVLCVNMSGMRTARRILTVVTLSLPMFRLLAVGFLYSLANIFRLLTTVSILDMWPISTPLRLM